MKNVNSIYRGDHFTIYTNTKYIQMSNKKEIYLYTDKHKNNSIEIMLDKNIFLQLEFSSHKMSWRRFQVSVIFNLHCCF